MPNEANPGQGGQDEFTIPQVSKCWKGLEAVRLRPAMYIGSTGEMGLHHLVYEVVDNSVDEALAGYATEVNVTIHDDNSVTVIDNGRGIPVDMHEEEGVSAAQVVMTKLHAGGKFDSKSYKVSGGLHGVGVSCVNALSERLELEIWRRGGGQHLAAGIRLRRSQGSAGEDRQGGPQDRHARDLQARPDHHERSTEFNYDTLAKRLRQLAFLNKGLKITLTDEREDPDKARRVHLQRRHRRVHQAPQRGKQVLHEKPIHFEAEREMPNGSARSPWKWRCSTTTATRRTMLSFANNINTVDGGTHLTRILLGADPHHQRVRPGGRACSRTSRKT